MKKLVYLFFEGINFILLKIYVVINFEFEFG